MGTVIELYASPAPFEGGCRVGVLWDHQREVFQEKASEYLKAHPLGDEEWYLADDEKEGGGGGDGGAIASQQEVAERFVGFEWNPHRVRKKRKEYIAPADEDDSDEHSSEWDEPDFEVWYMNRRKFCWCVTRGCSHRWSRVVALWTGNIIATDSQISMASPRPEESSGGRSRCGNVAKQSSSGAQIFNDR